MSMASKWDGLQLNSCTRGVGAPVQGCELGRVVSTAPTERVRGNAASLERYAMVCAGVP